MFVAAAAVAAALFRLKGDFDQFCFYETLAEEDFDLFAAAAVL